MAGGQGQARGRAARRGAARLRLSCVRTRARARAPAVEEGEGLHCKSLELRARPPVGQRRQLCRVVCAAVARGGPGGRARELARVARRMRPQTRAHASSRALHLRIHPPPPRAGAHSPPAAQTPAAAPRGSPRPGGGGGGQGRPLALRFTACAGRLLSQRPRRPAARTPRSRAAPHHLAVAVPEDLNGQRAVQVAPQHAQEHGRLRGRRERGWVACPSAGRHEGTPAARGAGGRCPRCPSPAFYLSLARAPVAGSRSRPR